MKNELKQAILNTVSTLRDLIIKLHVSSESKADEINKLEKQVCELKAELNECRHIPAKVLGPPSSVERHEPAGQSAGSMAWYCGRDGKPSESDKMNGNTVVATGVTGLFSDAVGSGVAKNYFICRSKAKATQLKRKLQNF